MIQFLKSLRCLNKHAFENKEIIIRARNSNGFVDYIAILPVCTRCGKIANLEIKEL